MEATSDQSGQSREHIPIHFNGKFITSSSSSSSSSSSLHRHYIILPIIILPIIIILTSSLHHLYIIPISIETVRDFSNAWKRQAIKAVNHASTFPYISMESSLHHHHHHHPYIVITSSSSSSSSLHRHYIIIIIIIILTSSLHHPSHHHPSHHHPSHHHHPYIVITSYFPSSSSLHHHYIVFTSFRSVSRLLGISPMHGSGKQSKRSIIMGSPRHLNVTYHTYFVLAGNGLLLLHPGKYFRILDIVYSLL